MDTAKGFRKTYGGLKKIGDVEWGTAPTFDEHIERKPSWIFKDKDFPSIVTLDRQGFRGPAGLYLRREGILSMELVYKARGRMARRGRYAQQRPVTSCPAASVESEIRPSSERLPHEGRVRCGRSPVRHEPPFQLGGDRPPER
ncbi:hypothetical protein RsS62_51690 [Rhizobium dioscoreae]|uniref:Uncharacterized protein n=1 Tax=Rhizobium dioscoreae TaxID=2653122 RepID=A0ABQ0ZE46_9HYPH|nr:hypothetical protein RsS62_51690 [Rhizobium dioscoreae]GES53682.1 hypothetical protein RsS93_62960 [Rhizobium dioscoreae]GLU85143.1 hypothetical protein Rhsp01_63190 [Rhizobium sp. NBRC 114257]